MPDEPLGTRRGTVRHLLPRGNVIGEETSGGKNIKKENRKGRRESASFYKSTLLLDRL